MAEIRLPGGKVAVVDDEDYEVLSRFRWSSDGRYAGRKGLYSEGVLKGRSILMHRQILGLLDSGYTVQVDHINCNKLDNRRLNLRVCNRSQNMANSRVRKESKTGYKGVVFRGRGLSKPWVASISLGDRTKHLGYYSSKEEAALAYNVAALKYRGSFARLNEVRV